MTRIRSVGCAHKVDGHATMLPPSNMMTLRRLILSILRPGLNCKATICCASLASLWPVRRMLVYPVTVIERQTSTYHS